MSQYVEIESCWDSCTFHCPVCGRVVFTEEGNPTTQPCEHVLFSWINQVGEYYNPAPDMRALLEEEDPAPLPCDSDFLERCPDSAVLFGFHSQGMACGPVSLTIVHGIRFPEPVAED
jgi:hypothetical protein